MLTLYSPEKGAGEDVSSVYHGGIFSVTAWLIEYRTTKWNTGRKCECHVNNVLVVGVRAFHALADCMRASKLRTMKLFSDSIIK